MPLVGIARHIRDGRTESDGTTTANTPHTQFLKTQGECKLISTVHAKDGNTP